VGLGELTGQRRLIYIGNHDIKGKAEAFEEKFSSGASGSENKGQGQRHKGAPFREGKLSDIGGGVNKWRGQMSENAEFRMRNLKASVT
jgi:hypothetical protein